MFFLDIKLLPVNSYRKYLSSNISGNKQIHNSPYYTDYSVHVSEPPNENCFEMSKIDINSVLTPHLSFSNILFYVAIHLAKTLPKILPNFEHVTLLICIDIVFCTVNIQHFA